MKECDCFAVRCVPLLTSSRIHVPCEQKLLGPLDMQSASNHGAWGVAGRGRATGVSLLQRQLCALGFLVRLERGKCAAWGDCCCALCNPAVIYPLPCRPYQSIFQFTRIGHITQVDPKPCNLATLTSVLGLAIMAKQDMSICWATTG